MSFISNNAASSIATVLGTLILATAIALFLALNAGGAGAQTVEDDHGDTFDTSTLVELGSSVDGRIDPGDDRDVFKIDLSDASGQTDLWAYTLGEFDTYGGLYDGAGNLVELSDDGYFVDSIRGFSIRSVVHPGIYYVIAVSFDGDPGDYTFHAQAVVEPGSTIETAKPLILDSRDGGTINTLDDEDYYKLEFTESKHVTIYAVTANVSLIDAFLLDAEGNEISANIRPLRLRGFGSLFPVGFTIEEDLEPGTYYLQVVNPLAPDPDEAEPEETESEEIETEEPPLPFRPAPYGIFYFEDTEYSEFLEDCNSQTEALDDPEIGDPLNACQWHFHHPEWQDINIGSVWADGIKGEGVNVAIVDDGMYQDHEDLKDNVDTSLSLNFETGENDIYGRHDHHGTHVAGMVAARDNDIGVRGVAPRATIHGFNLLSGFNTTGLNIVRALTNSADVTAVSNNSWGWRDSPGLSPSFSFWKQAVRSGTALGYDGKGVLYVWSAGNGHLLGDDSNLTEFANDYGVTAACSVNTQGTRSGYSEMGANLWVCAPSNDRPLSLGGVAGILTTENSDRYYQDFGGTSAAAPIVAGVGALTREANPDLTWRDVKMILAASAQKNDPASQGWDAGAPMHPVSSVESYSFNHEYGFGVVDAEGAVNLAKRWTNLPAAQVATVVSEELESEIPDAPAVGEPTTVTHALTVDSDIEFTEFVEVTVVFEHDSFRDLEILLESPSGAISRLAVPFDTFDGVSAFLEVAFSPLHGSWQFGSAKHLGEDPNGEWKLHITDHLHVVDGTFMGFAITVYGHERAAGAATLDSVAVHPGGERLDVAWSAPGGAGESEITGYDIRYIATDDDETDPSAWTALEGVWSAEAGGDLTYTISGLTDGTQYDVQVRAVNSVGGGLWSEEGTGTPMSSSCVADGAVSDRTNGGLINDCETLLEARDTLAGSATLNWSSDADITTWDGIHLTGDPLRVTNVTLLNSQLDGSIPAALGGLEELAILNLRNNDLTGSIPAELSNLANLENLLLHNNSLSGEIPDLSDLSNLKMLWLSGNDLGSGQGVPTWLNSMSNLESLNLWGNDLGGQIPDLSGMTSLIHLRLHSTGLTGSIPASLGDMSNLRGLYLHNNNLSGTIPGELGQLATLAGLYLHGNNLSGTIPSELGQLTNLRRIWLHSNGLSGAIPSELSGMSGLLDLNLHSNRLSGVIPPELGDITTLESLRLHNNQLSGSIPSELGDLSNLTGLWLQSNRLTGAIPAELGNLGDTLTQWRLGGNRLSGCVPAGLASVEDNDMASLGLQVCP